MRLKRIKDGEVHEARVTALLNKSLPRCEPEIVLDNGHPLHSSEFGQWAIIDGRCFDFELCEAVGFQVLHE